MGAFSDFKCQCGYTAVARWAIGINPTYKNEKGQIFEIDILDEICL